MKLTTRHPQTKANPARNRFARRLTLGIFLCMLTGCASPGSVERGMTEKAWRRTADDEVLIGQSDNGERVWQSGDRFFHFNDGKLTRTSGGGQQVQVMLD